ncbi:hypothetical protein C8J57DRAFT_1256476 [Mycena rebaudengoi]|nr:hypothetical protein C8J57DRAFT_1256476 [Mycena rebaudengoi]
MTPFLFLWIFSQIQHPAYGQTLPVSWFSPLKSVCSMGDYPTSDILNASSIMKHQEQVFGNYMQPVNAVLGILHMEKMSPLRASNQCICNVCESRSRNFAYGENESVVASMHNLRNLIVLFWGVQTRFLSHFREPWDQFEH